MTVVRDVRQRSLPKKSRRHEQPRDSHFKTCNDPAENVRIAKAQSTPALSTPWSKRSSSSTANTCTDQPGREIITNSKGRLENLRAELRTCVGSNEAFTVTFSRRQPRTRSQQLKAIMSEMKGSQAYGIGRRNQLYQTDYLSAYSEATVRQELQQLEQLFIACDADGSGELSLEEFRNTFKQFPHLKQTFAGLGIQPHQSELVFKSMDKSGRGDLTIAEFIDGLQELLSCKGDGEIDLAQLRGRTSKEGKTAKGKGKGRVPDKGHASRGRANSRADNGKAGGRAVTHERSDPRDVYRCSERISIA